MTDAQATIIFDLDGTLVDTAPDLTGALNAVLAKAGHRPVSEAETRRMVGRGARALIENALAATGAPPDADLVTRMLADYLEFYGDHLADHSAPFPNVAETLAALRDEGFRLAVCTNKPHALSRRLLRAVGLDRHFAAVLGGDSLPVRKPDPGHLIETVRQAGGQPERAVMVGDSVTDLAAARAADIPVVLVSFGYTETPAHMLGADALIDDFAALKPALARLLGPAMEKGERRQAG